MTVPQVAEQLGVNNGKVLAWINGGELVAINVARRTDGQRPRYRVTATALTDFLASRQTRPPVKPIRRRRQTTAPSGPY
jgi:excisionase family DNA binding protein